MGKSILKRVIESLLMFLLIINIACQKPVEQVETKDVNSNSVSNLTESLSNNTELAANYDNAVPPLLIRKVTKHGSKPPLQLYYFDFEFKSRQDDYKWLLINYHFDEILPDSGTFISYKESKSPLGAEEFFDKQKQNKVVLISFFGENSFQALRLPPKGTIKFDSFRLGSDSDMSEIEVWEVRSLLVNGETPLEEWLPYGTLSEATIYPIKYDEGRSLDIVLNQNTNSTRTDYPTEKVKFVTAKGLRKWKIPFKVSIEEQNY